MSSCPSLPTGPPKPCVVAFYTQMDKTTSNEPPPQPRVRKVTTVINSLAVVVRDTPTELGVWVLTACQEKILPKTQPHIFVECRLGTWMTVGVYPDGTVASFSPWSFILSAYQMSIDNTGTQLFLKIKASEFQYEKTITQKEFIETHLGGSSNSYYDNDRHSAHFFMVPGFGLVLAHHDFLQRQKDEGENLAAWIQWCGDASKGCCWIVNSLSNNVEEKFTERELREAAELIKNRKVDAEFPEHNGRVIARHFGLITDVNAPKSTVNVWSPHVSLDLDHTARIPTPPKQRDVDSPMLPPLIGQWVQFDINASDMKKYVTSKTANRLLIPEYLPITSPAGVGVAHSNKVVRVMISSVLVTGTSHPLLFELPHFGFVLDRKASLVSGTHVQLVLEKTSNRIRKMGGVCWRVIDSVEVKPDDVTVEKLQDLMVHYVPLKDAMDISLFNSNDKNALQSKDQYLNVKSAPSIQHTNSGSNANPNSNPNSHSHSNATSHTGIITLKYQQPPQQLQYQENRRDYYNVATAPIQIAHERNHYQSNKRKQMVYTGATMEGYALAEKVQTTNNSGVLWMFEATTISMDDASTESKRSVPFTVHFIYNNHIDLKVGDYAYMKLVQKEDELSKNGFRWLLVSAAKTSPPFNIHIKGYNFYITDILAYNGLDRYNRHSFHSKLFPCVLDINSLVMNPASISSFSALVTRLKVPVPNSDISAFSWVIHSIISIPPAASFYLAHQSFTVRTFTRGYLQNSTDARSEYSSASPPLKTVANE
uniref:Uncharacterized protein n=1 Tax=Caenorhabditis japonica TaxID=281687 RepID=A0A8R1HKK0_CAEJA